MDGRDRQFFETALCDNDVEAMAKRLGFSVTATPVEGPALRAWGLDSEFVGEADRLCILAANPGFRLLYLDHDGSSSKVRQAMLAVHRASPQAAVLWWWSTPEHWTLAMVDDNGAGRRRVKKLVLDRAHPDKVGMMQWMGLSANRRVPTDGVGDHDEARAWREHIAHILDQEGVTRAFFRRFSQGLDELVETMEQGPDDEELRHDIALGTLLRVIFLYFLQARGALDGDRRFVMRQFHAPRTETSFYRAVLRPLFFGALNCPCDVRTEAVKAFGELPFLNGGLFESSAAERAHPDLDWDDEVWRSILEELFECHRFAVEWADGADLCCAVDPEMLGKVFEGLMYGDRRRRSASFYTPRDVVRSMVRQTLSAWLGEAADLECEEATDLVEARAHRLSAPARRRAREALAELTVLDPAVGTGAFLLEVLRVLRRIDHSLDAAEGVVRTPGERYDRMRNLVHDHLCGVDIQPTAVRLCELRIWLAMLAALPVLPARQMPPLPNLSHRLCTGNSLVEPLDWVRFRSGGDAMSVGRTRRRFDRRSVDRLAVLYRAYTRAHGDEKRELRAAIDRVQKELEEQILDARIAHVRTKLQPYQALDESDDLFGEKGQLDSGQQAQKQRLTAELEALQQGREDLEADRRREGGFCFDAHFAPVMARGGFDLVLTNPPWVRTKRIDRGTRDLYRARYGGQDRRLWPRAQEHGIRAPFGAQIDMASLFLERSLELMRPGARLCALVPIKLFRSLHGSALRGVLAEHQIEYLEDRSEDEEAMFDATTYPAILRVRKRPAESTALEPVEVNVWRQGAPRRFRTPLKNLGVHGEDPREPWMLVPPEVERIFRIMQERSVSLGSVEDLPIRGGVKTGCNAAFIMAPEEAKSTFSKEIRAHYMRWVVRGRDVAHDGVKQRKKIIWPVDDKSRIARGLPDELEAYFEARRLRLEGRSDYRKGPIWTLFRRHDDVEDPGVVWRDMGEKLKAAAIDANSIPLNTVYYLPTPTEAAAAALITLFHSAPMRAIAYAIAERARGGWRRHFAWVMKLLPIPRKWLAHWTSGHFEMLDQPGGIPRYFGLTSEETQRLSRWRLGHRALDSSAEVA